MFRAKTYGRLWFEHVNHNYCPYYLNSTHLQCPCVEYANLGEFLKSRGIDIDHPQIREYFGEHLGGPVDKNNLTTDDKLDMIITLLESLTSYFKAVYLPSEDDDA